VETREKCFVKKSIFFLLSSVASAGDLVQLQLNEYLSNFCDEGVVDLIIYCSLFHRMVYRIISGVIKFDFEYVN
jgi:hypothetical protein